MPSIQSDSMPDIYHFKLYVAGKTEKSLTAFANLKKICEKYLSGRCRIEVIDILESPTTAKVEQITAVPMLVKQLPSPKRKIIGDLSNTQRVMVALDLVIQH